ncbi:AI-2E family transporter [bacterium]|nr:AI-2E family transporter [bacterium]NBX97481.1 AI-2E family transporter [bacterium]NDC95003.1 AI-2E family transporter [bacterium]NDD82898.1 AI-2E family transporter [bacterium]NDG31410.1 AI-2E family transporter [bacterium]
MIRVTPTQKYYIAIATFALIIFAAYFLRSYFATFFISGVLAYLFWPINKRLSKRMGKNSAVALTIVFSAFALIIPLVLVLLLAVSQLRNQVDNIQVLASSADLSKFGDQVVTTINNLLSYIPFIKFTVTEASLISFIKDAMQTISSGLINYIKNTATSVAGFFTGFIVFIFVYISALRHGETLIRIFRDINPLGKQVSDLYIAKTAAMVKGTVYGQFVIALCQGFAGALSMLFAGVSGFFAIMFIVFSLLSIIPLGSGIILIPIGGLMIIFGNVWGGVIVLATHFIITTNIDSILKPKLVPKSARLDPALMLVSVFSGIAMFGFLGIIVGPTIMIIVVTTIQVYLQVYGSEQDMPVKPIKVVN